MTAEARRARVPIVPEIDTERLHLEREELLPETFQDSTGFLRSEWRYALRRQDRQTEQR